MFGHLFRRYKKIKTFTYYIPAPPKRPTGYREKELDKIVYELTQAGHDILEVKMQQVSGNDSSGIMVLLLLGAKTEQAARLNLDFAEEYGLNNKPNEGIELE